MIVKIVVPAAEQGGCWAEVPALPGCVSRADSIDDLLANMREAVQAWFAAADEAGDESPERKVMELEV